MQRGELFFAPFLYADLGQSKRRPVCVLSTEPFNAGPDVVVAMVTSSRARLMAPGLGDVPLRDWEATGLLAPSTVRTGRLQTVERTLLEGRLGMLSEADLIATTQAVRAVLGLDK